jgi:NAD(P)-dependent dehydrogenase (short-subunit alcohol dehydrogenase family)
LKEHLMSFQIDLSGRSALVTGGGRGIGRETAHLLSRAGAFVTIAEFDESSAQAVAREIEALGGQSLAVQTDVTKTDDAERAVSASVEKFGRIDILVNNAARWTTKRFVEMSPEEYDVDIGVCMMGPIHLSKAAVPHMISQSYGRIVSLISDAGRIGEPNLTIYSAAKAGVVGFTKALAKEVGRFGITVNGVSPGTTHTPGSDPVIAAWGGEEKVARAYPLRRLGQPIDIASAIVFLASDYSGWTTGQILSVNGGYAMPD